MVICICMFHDDKGGGNALVAPQRLETKRATHTDTDSRKPMPRRTGACILLTCGPEVPSHFAAGKENRMHTHQLPLKLPFAVICYVQKQSARRDEAGNSLKSVDQFLRFAVA
eukprot:6201013-Pleurochrysis_carterae.AAC.2